MLYDKPITLINLNSITYTNVRSCGVMELLTRQPMDKPGVDCDECTSSVLLGHPDNNPPHVSPSLSIILMTRLNESEIKTGGVELFNILQCQDSRLLMECESSFVFISSKNTVNNLNNVLSNITPLTHRTEWE